MPEVYKAKAKSSRRKERSPVVATVKELVKKEKNGGLFSAFTVMPKQVKFEAQDKDEKIVMLLRRHWVTNVPWILLIIVMILVPMFKIEWPLMEFLSEKIKFLLGILWYSLIVVIVFEKVMLWYYNVNIVTDERMIDVDFFSLLFKEVNVAQLNKIQDVTYRQIGAVTALFNYGDVLIQTASEVPTFVFESVPQPDKVTRILSELVQQEELEALEGRLR